MLKLETIRALLQDRQLAKVSAAMGGEVKERTLRRLRDGETTNPQNAHLEAVSDYLENQIREAGFIPKI